MFNLRVMLNQFLIYPVHTSFFAAVLGLLLVMPLIRPPLIISAILVGMLVYLSLFFGGKFALAAARKS
ncbi:MAG: hypothetical protein ACR2HF_03730 [Methylococcaceae bacterium]